MIVVDTSALIAILLDEVDREACLDALARHHERYMSAGTLAEAYIVAIGRDLGPHLVELVEELKIAILPMTADVAYQAAKPTAIGVRDDTAPRSTTATAFPTLRQRTWAVRCCSSGTISERPISSVPFSHFAKRLHRGFFCRSRPVASNHVLARAAAGK